MKDDPVAVEEQAEEIKARYTQYLQGVMELNIASDRSRGA